MIKNDSFPTVMVEDVGCSLHWHKYVAYVKRFFFLFLFLFVVVVLQQQSIHIQSFQTSPPPATLSLPNINITEHSGVFFFLSKSHNGVPLEAKRNVSIVAHSWHRVRLSVTDPIRRGEEGMSGELKLFRTVLIT